MSQSSSATVVQQNITIYNTSVNDSLVSLGLTPIPPGLPVPTQTQKALSQMTGVLLTRFAADFAASGITLPASNHDGGYMGPWTGNVAGTAPKCVVDQIVGDFSRWGLSSAFSQEGQGPVEIAQAITQEIGSQGGQAGFVSGTRQITSSESLYWMAGYATVSITQDELGILYVFGATEAIDLFA